MKDQFGMHKMFFGMVAAAVVGILIFKGIMIGTAVSKGERIYNIDVHTYVGVESYTAKNYTVDEKTNCITFNDMVGRKHTVCGNYTVTQY
jgi:hypothetical protein